MIFVVAGNYQQFQRWCHENKINPRDHHKVLYFGSERSVRGCRITSEDQLVYTGTTHPQAEEIQKAIEIARLGS